MSTVKRFEPVSVMKIAAICYAALGLLEGALFSIIFSFLAMAGPAQEKMPRFLGPLFGAFSILFFPIVFAVVGGLMA